MRDGRSIRAEAAKKLGPTELPDETISRGHLVAKGPKNDGVDVIFTLGCGRIIDVYDGRLDEDIKIIDGWHERVAAHAADGYASMTGKPGCAVVTAGPGMAGGPFGARPGVRQYIINTGMSACRITCRVTPPIASSRRRRWP